MRLDVADDGARIGYVDVDHGAVARMEAEAKRWWVYDIYYDTPAASDGGRL